MFTQTLKQFFPNSLIVDAALKFPITPQGWEVTMPDQTECRFHEKDFWLILNLQDMLTGGWGKMPHELKSIQNYYQNALGVKPGPSLLRMVLKQYQR